MSQTAKIVLAIVVVLLLIGGGYWWFTREHASPTEEMNEQTKTSESSSDVTTLPSGSAASDQAIDQDLSSIDAQITAANKDTASAGASVDAAQ